MCELISLTLFLNGVTWFLDEPVASGKTAPEVRRLAEANASAVDLIQSVDLTSERTRDLPRQSPPAKGLRQSTWRWSKQGSVERVRYRYHDLDPDSRGLPRNLGDLIQDGRSRKSLLNWDPKHPQAITPVQQGTVRATVEPQTPELPGWFADPAVSLCMRLSYSARDRPRLLAELVRQSPRVILKGKERVRGHETWRIFLEHPGIRGKRNPDDYFEVFLDPAVNFMISRVITRRGGIKTTEGDTVWTTTTDVLSFRDCGQGVFIPVETEEIVLDSRYKDDVPLFVYHESVSGLVVNQELPPDALDFKFPKYAQVRFLPPVKGKVKAQLWGDDDKPILDINGSRDLMKYMVTHQEPGWLNVSPTALGAVSIATVVLGVLTLTMRRRRRGEAS